MWLLVVGIDLFFVVVEGSANWFGTVQGNLVLPIFLHFSCSFFNDIYRNIVKGDMTLLCLVWIVFLYTLSLFCRTRNPRLVILTFSSSSIFCLIFFEAPASSTRAAPCYPEISTRAKTPSSSEIGPAAQTRKIPLLPLSRKCRLDVAVSKPVGVRW